LGRREFELGLLEAAIQERHEVAADGVQLAGAAAAKGSDVLLVDREAFGFPGGVDLAGKAGNSVVGHIEACAYCKARRVSFASATGASVGG
jgi:hypothetical protein